MEKIHILIVEDEPLIARDLAYMLEDLEYEISGIAYNAIDALRIVKEKQVDLALLDINIDGDVDGITLASQLGSIPFIFLTSYSSKQILAEAKKTEPLAYLVKPIDEHDLLTTIDVAFYNYEQKKEGKNTGEVDDLPDTIFIKSGHSYIKVKTDEIFYVEANDNYCTIHSKVKKFLVSQTLKSVEARLQPYGFLRIHRSYMVNPIQVTKFTDISVYLDRVELPLSRKYKMAFKSKLNFL